MLLHESSITAVRVLPTDPSSDGNRHYSVSNFALGKNVTTFKEIFDSSGAVLTGTDMPLDYPGIGVHGNLRPLVAYGFSPYEALLTATRYPVEYQGIDDDLGTIEPGKLADMAFVEGNPLEQIEDAIQVKMTMKNGELFTIQDLVEPFSS